MTTVFALSFHFWLPRAKYGLKFLCNLTILSLMYTTSHSVHLHVCENLMIWKQYNWTGDRWDFVMVQHVQLYNGSLPNVALIFISTTVADILQDLFDQAERTVPFNQEITQIKLQWQLLNPTHTLHDAHKTELVFLTNSMFKVREVLSFNEYENQSMSKSTCKHDSPRSDCS